MNICHRRSISFILGLVIRPDKRMSISIGFFITPYSSYTNNNDSNYANPLSIDLRSSRQVPKWNWYSTLELFCYVWVLCSRMAMKQVPQVRQWFYLLSILFAGWYWHRSYFFQAHSDPVIYICTYNPKIVALLNFNNLYQTLYSQKLQFSQL